MNKFPCILGLSLLITPLISGKYLLAIPPLNTVPETDVNEPFCYMKTTDGKILDLGKLCENKTPSTIFHSCITGSNIAAKVSINNVNYDGQFLSGQIINKGCKIVKNIKVNYEVLDELGNPIDNGFITTQPVTVEPGKSATFRGEVVAGAKILATHADGQE